MKHSNRNSSDNVICRLLGINYPIIQGPFGGGLSTVELVATVSNNGGLGSFGAHLLSPDEIIQLGEEIRQQTQRPFSLNLWVSKEDAEMDDITEQDYRTCAADLTSAFPELAHTIPDWADRPVEYSFEQQAEAVIRAKPKAFSFVYGVPSKEILLECKRAGIVTIGAATTVEEALAHENAGVDAVVVSGFEAGGHRPSFLRQAEDSLVGTISLVPSARDQLKIPIIAAGGIADTRGVQAALALGADAAQLGTAFLACHESGAAAAHRQRILDNQTEWGVLSRAYTGRLARFLDNGVTKHFQNNTHKTLPFPLQGWLMSTIKQQAKADDDPHMLGAYSGQSSPLVHQESATALMQQLTEPFRLD